MDDDSSTASVPNNDQENEKEALVSEIMNALNDLSQDEVRQFLLLLLRQTEQENGRGESRDTPCQKSEGNGNAVCNFKVE